MNRDDELESRRQEMTELVGEWCQAIIDWYKNGEFPLTTPEERRRFLQSYSVWGNRRRSKLVGMQLGVSIIDAYERKKDGPQPLPATPNKPQSRADQHYNDPPPHSSTL